jgi:hypothetical protein
MLTPWSAGDSVPAVRIQILASKYNGPGQILPTVGSRAVVSVNPIGEQSG